MLLINILIMLLIPFVLGLFLLSLFLQKGSTQLNFWEKLALAFAVGLGFLTIIMFILAFLRIPLTFWSILGATTLITAAITSYLIKAKTFCLSLNEIKASLRISNPKFNLFEYVLICLISLKVVYVFFETLVKPVIDVDAFQQYSIIAKAIFYKKTFLLPYLTQFMGDKPPLPFLAQGWVFLGLHTIDDAILKILSPVLFLCLLTIFYGVLRRYYSRTYSLLFTLLLSTLPFLVFHVATAYADFPVTFYYATATIYLFLFMKEFAQENKEKSYAYLIVSMLLLAITVYAKKAGIVLAGVNLFILLLYLLTYRKNMVKPDIKRFFVAFLIFIISIMPWIILGSMGTIITVIKSLAGVEIQGAVGPAVAGDTLSDKITTIYSIFSKKLFLYADWHLLWALFLAGLLFFYKKSFSKPLIFLLMIIFIDLLALFVQFGTGETFRWLLDGTLFDRLIMNEVPVVLYFCAEAILPSISAKKD